MAAKGKVKPVIIRKGQKTPFHRSTLQEADERVEAVKLLLGRGASRYIIHRHCRERFGVVWQTAERYMRRARELMLAECGKGREEVRGEAISFYKSVLLGTEGVTMRDKLTARERLDDLYGIKAPMQHRIGDPEGKPLATQVVAPVVNFIIPDNGRGLNRSPVVAEARPAAGGNGGNGENAGNGH